MKVLGIGNAIVDVICKVDEGYIERNSLTKSTMKLVNENELKKLLIPKKIDNIGLLAVEMFLTENDEILINEIAPRPHNSGHFSIEACPTSQFEQHLRSILNLPLGKTSHKNFAVMLNLVGDYGFNGNVFYENLESVFSEADTHIHIYGKEKTRQNTTEQKKTSANLVGN